jgi:PKD repeat protein
VPTSVAANTIFTAQVSISQDPNNLTVQSTEFNFGDSVVRRVNGLQTTHVYTSAGNYNIRATVTFSDGQQATAEAGIRVTLSATTTTTTIAP